MAINPLKVFLFVLGGTVAAAGTAFYSGAWRPETVPKQDAASVSGAAAPAAATADAGSATPADTRTADGKQPKPQQQAALDLSNQPAMTATEPQAEAGVSAAAQGSQMAPAGEPTPSGNADASGAATPDGASATQQAALDPLSGDARQDGEASAAPASNPPGVQVQPAVGDRNTPTFDIVRVEPDGSTVVAGRAAPDAKVDLLLGSTVLGSATASGAGDFAIVLDAPLSPGDHQIQLKGTTAAGESDISRQTALVSVPKGGKGQVLAMVEEPGNASRVLVAPQVPKEGSPAAAAPMAEAPQPEAENAPATVEAPPADTGAASAAEQQASLSTPPNPAGAAGTGGEPASVSVQAVEIEGRKVFVAGIAPAGSTVRVYLDDTLLGDATASPGGEFLVETVRDLPVGSYTVRVDQLKGDNSTVAARAAVPFEREAGENIAAVASGLSGEAQSGEGPAPKDPSSPATATEQPVMAQGEAAGVEATAGAAGSGDAASSSPTSASRPPAADDGNGGQATATAQPDAGGSQPDAASGASATGNAQFTTEVPTNLQGRPSAQPVPDASASAAAPWPADPGVSQDLSAVPPAIGSQSGGNEAGSPMQSQQTTSAPEAGTQQLSEATAPGTAPTTASPQAAGTEPQSGGSAGTIAADQSQPAGTGAPAPALTESQAADAPAVGAAADQPGTAGSSVAASPVTVEPDTAGTPASSQAATQAAGDEAGSPAAAPPAAADPNMAGATAGGQPTAQAAPGEAPVATAPKLKNVRAAVIIRRGDSLWRISRRVYGLGTRYSTIYLANLDQIRNPDLILPGQVFAVPTRSQEGEAANIDALGGQSTSTAE